MTQPSTMLDAALALWDAGCSVVRVKPDGTKAPLGQWKTYTETRADRSTVEAWFTGGHPGLGIVTGAISGNLEMLELEGRAVATGVHTELAELAAASGLGQLWSTVLTGYCETTPSGGLHLLYRVDGTPIPGNTKLARDTDGKLPLIETRGEGGFVVVAPSHGPAHDTGQPWVLAAGGPATIPTITAGEHRALHVLARCVDRAPAPTPTPDPVFAAPGTPTATGLSPGDDYNARATWDEILTPHGWTKFFNHRGVQHWTRPGKTRATSATTGYGDRGDYLYVFTSSTELPTEQALSKFATHTHLEHGGDYRAAAAALKMAGYGDRPAERTLQILPGHQQHPTDGTAALKVAIPGQDIPTSVTATLTDHGNAQLLIAAHGQHLRYVPSRGQWLTWSGRHWSWCEDDGEAVQAATDAICSIAPADDAERKHKTRSLSRRALESAVALARRDTRVRVTADQLDADPHALNTPAGVVNLRTGTLTPPDPSQLHTRLTGAPYDAAQPTPRWDAFLADTFGGDTEMLEFVRRLAGYSATGAVTHHVLPFLHGSGGNGKSVFLDVIRRVLGDYAATAPAGFLLTGQQQHETEIARLSGLRMVICSEVNQEARFDEAKVKQLTGGDALTARFMRQDHFTFTPTHHLWLMGNHQPRIGAGGESFARRLRLLPFTNTVPPEKKIDGLDQLLVDEEGPGILAWVVSGARAALAGGLAAPERVLAATRVYMEEEDAFARFIEDRCRLGGAPMVRVNTSQVRQAYETWCRDEGEKAAPPQVFGRELRTRYGIEQTRSHGHRYYVGITLLADEDTVTPDDDTVTPDEAPQHWNDR